MSNANPPTPPSVPTPPSPPAAPGNDFAQQAQEQDVGLVREFVDFLLHNKKWWLTPIILVLLLVGLLVVLSGTVAAPFIYPIF